ncbi:pyrimidine-nucleoside phosphorylase [Flavobacteriaceae bacterium LMO-SS05]
MIELIIKKRNGFELTKEDYKSIIDGFLSGDIPDYQVSAFLMAVYFNGMTTNETAILTEVMMRSGDVIDLSEIKGIKVDKHSTGGVGDKTTLVLTPLVAAAGVPVAKMSGRGLGHTGGTLDKMESIKGLSVDLTRAEFIENIKKHNIVVCGQNANLVPADKALYALRDVTGTVDNISLIASSIMSKKLACGADAIVIDIKVGYGAMMKTVEEAEALANMMIGIGSKMNRKVITVFTSMSEPLGFTIGNALEIKEVIDTLKGHGPEDLTALCLELGSHMLVLGKAAKTQDEAVELLKELIASGQAYEKFKELVAAQGGDTEVLDHVELLPSTKFHQTYRSKKSGYINELNAMDIGLASVKLGAGRETKHSEIDYGAGIRLKKKIGDYVKMNEELAILYSNTESSFEKASKIMDLAYIISDEKPEHKPLILKTIL